jgi:hypothetical protein
MRLIVNETQYNKILLEEHKNFKEAEKWSSYLSSTLLTHILKLEIPEDVFTYKNLKNKLNTYSFFKSLPIESIIINIIKKNNPYNKIDVDINFNPYWTYLISNEVGKEHIVDAEFDVEVFLPSSLNNDDIKNLYTKIENNLTDQFINIHQWFNKKRKEDTIRDLLEQYNYKSYILEPGVDYGSLGDEIGVLNYYVNKITDKPIHILTVSGDTIVVDMSKFTPEQIKDIEEKINNHFPNNSDTSFNTTDRTLSFIHVDDIESEDKAWSSIYDDVTSDDDITPDVDITPDDSYISRSTWIEAARGPTNDMGAGTVNIDLLKDIEKAAKTTKIKIYISALRTNHLVGVNGGKRVSRHCFGDGADLHYFDEGNGWQKPSEATSLKTMPKKFMELGDKLIEQFKTQGYEKERGDKRYIWKSNTGGNHYNHIHLGVFPKNPKTGKAEKIAEWCMKMSEDGKGNTKIGKENGGFYKD